jgi:copper chaperone CopZ
MKLLKSFILVMLLLAFSSSIALAQSNTTVSTTDKIETITIKVKGVGCAGDLKDIAASVEKLNGVSSCEEGKMGSTSTFIVKYNPAVVTEKEIHTAIEGTPGCSNPDDRPYKVKT